MTRLLAVGLLYAISQIAVVGSCACVHSTPAPVQKGCCGEAPRPPEPCSCPHLSPTDSAPPLAFDAVAPAFAVVVADPPALRPPAGGPQAATEPASDPPLRPDIASFPLRR